MNPWEVMKAHEEGAKIEARSRFYNRGWADISDPKWDWCNCDYRVKPEPSKRPLSLDPKYIGKVVTNKIFNDFSMITAITRNGCFLLANFGKQTPDKLSDHWTFLDGSPCEEDAK